jgi:hypothetical protein
MSKPRWLALVALATCLFVFLVGPAAALAGDAPPAPDVSAIASALADQKWTMLAALLIGLVVRLLKEDVKFLPTIPARWRPLVALGLGVVSGFLLAFQPGVSWQKAFTEGAVASFLAMGGHSVIIEALRGGRELGSPKADEAPTKPRLPPDPPSGAGGLGVLALALLTITLQACAGGAKEPARDTARAAVVLVAEGVRVADETCAQVGAQQKNAALLKTCADAYDTTRASLLAAESAVDAWDAGEKKDLACALAASVRGLAQIANAVTHAGAELPLLVTDAMTLGAAFASGSCK